MTEPPLDKICETEDLLVYYLAGHSPAMGVSFSGVGHLDGTDQRPEFIGTCAMGGANHVLCVIDRRRSWYSAPGLRQQILEIVRGLKARHGITRLHTIGNSMGGFGALSFAGDLGAEYSIAISPQFTMDPSVIPEPRWSEFHGNVRVPDLARMEEKLSDKVRNHLFFGANSDLDAVHRAKYAALKRARIWTMRDVGHHAGRLLRAAGKLPVVHAAIANNNRKRLADVLRPFLAADQHFDGKEDSHDQV